MVSLDSFKGRANRDCGTQVAMFSEIQNKLANLKTNREMGDTFGDKNSPFCYTLALPLDGRLLRS
jgi:hypothetical protein